MGYLIPHAKYPTIFIVSHVNSYPGTSCTLSKYPKISNVTRHFLTMQFFTMHAVMFDHLEVLTELHIYRTRVRYLISTLLSIMIKQLRLNS